MSAASAALYGSGPVLPPPTHRTVAIAAALATAIQELSSPVAPLILPDLLPLIASYADGARLYIVDRGTLWSGSFRRWTPPPPKQPKPKSKPAVSAAEAAAKSKLARKTNQKAKIQAQKKAQADRDAAAAKLYTPFQFDEPLTVPSKRSHLERKYKGPPAADSSSEDDDGEAGAGSDSDDADEDRSKRPELLPDGSDAPYTLVVCKVPKFLGANITNEPGGGMTISPSINFMCAMNDSFYWLSDGKLWRYDGQWPPVSLPPLPSIPQRGRSVQFRGHPMIARPSNGTIIVPGGQFQGSATSTVYVFDTPSGAWNKTRIIPDMPQKLMGHSAVLKPGSDSDGGDLMYIIGGQITSTTMPHAKVHRYSFDTSDWNTLPPMHIPRESAASGALSDGSIVVVGGCREEISTGLQSAERYLPDSNKWVMLPAMGGGRTYLTMHVLSDNSLLAVSGYGGMKADPEASLEWLPTVQPAEKPAAKTSAPAPVVFAARWLPIAAREAVTGDVGRICGDSHSVIR